MRGQKVFSTWRRVPTGKLSRSTAIRRGSSDGEAAINTPLGATRLSPSVSASVPVLIQKSIFDFRIDGV
jgi:hypothetical protein